MLIEHYYEKQDMPQAHTYLEEMRKRGINFDPYVEKTVSATIYAAVGVATEEEHKQGDGTAHLADTMGGGDDSMSEDIEEEEEDLDESFNTSFK